MRIYQKKKNKRYLMPEINNPKKSVLARILFVVNIVILAFLVISAYSPYFNPMGYPYLSNSGLAFPIFLLLNFLLAVFWLFTRQYRYHLIFWIVIIGIFPQLKIYYPINFGQSQPESAIKVLSYNVMSFNNLQKDEKGKNKILEYIAHQNADVVCLQEYAEVQSSSKFIIRSDVDNALSKYKYKRVTQVGAKNAHNKVALFSKYPILSEERIAYESQYNGSVAYRIRTEKDTLLVINNHFESNKITQEDRAVYQKLLKLKEQENLIEDTKGLLHKIINASIIREKQAKAVADYIDVAKEKTVLVCGDFNDSPLSRTNLILLRKELNDAYTYSGFGPGISYNRNLFYFRIDNILISNNLQAYNCIVDNSIKESDHYPIMCYFAYR